jgi:ketosteroid isomerase-like protein
MTEMPENVRTDIERLMIDYCYNVDALDDLNRFVSLFTDDIVTDMTGIGLPLMKGKDELRAFFDGVFNKMSHHFHFISNFRPDSWDGETGAMTAYVIGMGHAKDGNSVTLQVKYRMECVETEAGWKCRRYTITPMMPLPASLAKIHGEH